MCTLMNEPLQNICAACNSNRYCAPPSSVPSRPLSMVNWQCVICGLLNDKFQNICSNCNSNRYHSLAPTLFDNNYLPSMPSSDNMFNNQTQQVLPTWYCGECKWDNYIWQTQCNVCDKKANKDELELNIDAIYSDQNVVDRANYINMIHSVNSPKIIIDRIDTIQKQHEQRIMNEIKKTELKVYKYCNKHGLIPSDVIHLCTVFYVNVKCNFKQIYLRMLF